jgi:fumarate reductase subunit C
VTRAPDPAAHGTFWWIRRRSYAFFVLRELSAVFVAWSVVFVLLLVRALAQGEPEYRAFLGWAATPWVVVLNVVTLAFLVLHAVTWFNLTPAAMVVRLRGRRVPPAAVAGGAYAAWLVASAVVVWLVVTR